VALQIGQYHENEGVTSEDIKLFITNANYYTDTDAAFLSYFNTTFNADVEPGDFIWADGTGEDDSAQPTPWRSPQIFSDYLDSDDLTSGTTNVNLPSGASSNFTYYIYTATTLQNDAFGVKEGRKCP